MISSYFKNLFQSVFGLGKRPINAAIHSGCSQPTVGLGTGILGPESLGSLETGNQPSIGLGMADNCAQGETMASLGSSSLACLGLFGQPLVGLERLCPEENAGVDGPQIMAETGSTVLEPFSRDFTGFDPVSHIQPTHGNEIDASKSQAQLTIDMDMSRQLPESQPPELTAISYRAEEGLVTGGKVAAEPRLARKVFAGLVALGRAIGGRERDLVELAPEINESPKYRLGAIGALSGEKLALPALAKPALANGGALGAQVGMPGLGSQTALFQVNKLLGFNNAKKATPKIAKPLSVQANGPRRGDCLKKAANRRLPPRARQGIGSLVMVRTAAYSRFRRSLNPTKNYFPVGIPKEPFVEVPAPCLPKDNIGDTPMAKSDERPIFAPVVSLCGKVILSLNGLGSIF